MATLVAALGAFPARALAAVEGAGVHQYLQAQRTAEPPHIDGALTEAGWQTAPVFSSFVQSFPDPGAAPSERTEVRVLYDDRNLYIGITCFDRHPELILAPLGRRDTVPYSDYVQVVIDPAHDHRTGYRFTINAAGTLGDTLFYSDVRSTDDWDAVWEGATQLRPDGWTAELSIPLNQLRYPVADVQTWGFGVIRNLGRTHEEMDSVLLPKAANAYISRLGHLTGMTGLPQKVDVELSPYVAARTQLRPQFSDAAVPEPRLWDPSADVGLDYKLQLSSNLALNGTVNPDFGQVEADQIILNLSNVEQFFPEKRPFFLQGLDLFQPVGAGNGAVPQMLFYSRRIGLDAPIFTAAKLTGSVGPDLQIGVLDAVVGGPFQANVDEAVPDRRLAYHLSRPFHVGPGDALPTSPVVPENYFASVVRKTVARNATVGVQVMSALPLTSTCTEAQAALDESLQPASCLARGENAVAADFDVRSGDGNWVALGQATVSQAVGGPPVRILRDGTPLERGDVGYGAYATAGKLGGDPFRFDVSWNYASPKLELNAIGYLSMQNKQQLSAALHYVRSSGCGALVSCQVDLWANANLSTDGNQTDRGRSAGVTFNALTRGFVSLGAEAGYNENGYDLREISDTGVPWQRTHGPYLSAWASSDTSKPFQVSGDAASGFRPHQGPTPDVFGYTVDASLLYRPVSRLETKLSWTLDFTPHGPRYVDTLGEGTYLFGRLNATFNSLTLRQQWVMAPNLTLQGYAQLFTAFGHYGPFYTGTSSGGPIRQDALVPTVNPLDDPDFHDAQLNVNVVLRWEYRLGSTLFLVYTHSQTAAPTPAGAQPPLTIWPARLLQGPANDAFLVKWSYWWSA